MAAVTFTSKVNVQTEWAHGTLLKKVNECEWPHSNRTSRTECLVNGGFPHLLAKVSVHGWSQ